MGWHVGSGGDGGVGGNPKIVLSPLSGRAMERIEGSETSNQEFGPVPVQTLKFNLGVSILLGEGGGVFRVCVCVWKQSYLSTRCPQVFCGWCS